MPQVSASLLAADYARLGYEVQRAAHAGVDSFHFDMMDGHYVPNLALAPDHLLALRPYTHLPFHVHLELANPDELLAKFQRLQAELVVVCHDTCPAPGQTLECIHSQGQRTGLSLNPDEPLEMALPFLRQLDLLLILGVFPGFGGQPMHPGTLEKIAAARQALHHLRLDLPIAVDGGVNLSSAPALVQAGAELLIVGTALFRSPALPEVVRELKGLSAA